MRALAISIPIALISSGCSAKEASAEDLVAAVDDCGFETAVIAPSNSPDQSPFTLWHDSSEESADQKMSCLADFLIEREIEPPMMLGSPGFDPEMNIGFLFANITHECDLPQFALAHDGEGNAMIAGATDLQASQVACAESALNRQPQIQSVSVEAQPLPAPSINFDTMTSQ